MPSALGTLTRKQSGASSKLKKQHAQAQAAAAAQADEHYLSLPAVPHQPGSSSASSHSSHASSTLAASSVGPAYAASYLANGTDTSSTLPPSSAASVNTVSGTSYFQQQQSQLLSSSSSMVPESANETAVRELCNKRIQSIVYLKRTLEGRQSWLNTVRLSKRDLTAAFDTEKMKKRTIRNMFLGLSLAPLIEMSNLIDLCKAINSLFTELESWSENVDKDRNKVVRNLFRTTRGTKRLAATGSVEFMGAEAPNLMPNEHTYLLTPNLPFAPDYFHTFFTLADMLQEVYYKILLLVAATSKSAPPSSYNPSTTSSYSTIGSSSMSSSTSPVSKIGRGVSGSLSLSQSQLGSAVEHDLDNDFGRLLGVASAPASGSSKDGSLNNASLDLITKADGKLKKILIQTAKEVDALARHLMKEEITTLELQVRNLPNSSGSTALAPGANLAGVSSPLLGGDRSAFDGPRSSAPSIAGSIGSAAERGSATQGSLSALMSPIGGSPSVSREGSSQGFPLGSSPNFPPSSYASSNRPADPGLPQGGFRSPPGWSMAPAPAMVVPPPPPPPPQAPPSAPSPRSLLRRKSSGTLSKITAQLGGGGGGGTSSAPGASLPRQHLPLSPPPPPPPLPVSAAGSTLPARHGKTPSFSANSSGFEPGSISFVPNHNSLSGTFGRGRGDAAGDGAGGLGGSSGAAGSQGLQTGKEPNEGFHAALLSAVNEFGALSTDSSVDPGPGDVPSGPA
ncbi:hypothetical protein OC844_003953 [Tilletia horrida]|nr:hypothetical protein OC844_003953 [Tilletia horrida]